MVRALLVLVLLVPTSAHAGKFMMGEPSMKGADLFGDSFWGTVLDIGPQATMLTSVGPGGVSPAIGVGLIFGLFHHTESWFARPLVDLSYSIERALGADRWQVRTGAATSFGRISLALGWTTESIGEDSASAISPEVRIAHRAGSGTRHASFGVFMRADLFMQPTETHDDRVALGMYGALDVL
jgi:hypothetical protein